VGKLGGGSYGRAVRIVGWSLRRDVVRMRAGSLGGPGGKGGSRRRLGSLWGRSQGGQGLAGRVIPRGWLGVGENHTGSAAKGEEERSLSPMDVSHPTGPWDRCLSAGDQLRLVRLPFT
jgi:hypothetical protein